MSIVLIVTSDSVFEHIVGEELRKNDLIMECAKNSVAAATMIAEKEYHALIVDIDKDEELAFSLLHKLKMRQLKLPLVIVASELSADRLLLSYEFGAIDIIDKDFAERELANIFKQDIKGIN